MNISVTFRTGEGENWQKAYAEEKIARLKKYLDVPAEVHMILSTEKFRNVVEINLTANGWNVNAKEEAKDMHLAVDSCIVKIEKQLKKQKEKNRQHKPKSIRHPGGKSLEGPEEDDASSKVVETRKIILKPMSLEEAVLELESSKARFLIYRDTASEKVSLVHRLDDGKFAHIETNS
ncbi:MAG TPA: ribosome-associated translation inhibitor RaiA [Smithellaceae bacterium]|jgi:putative sigma-54 modulation protein|nr:ribosome-associated translation inhibitor RaiA [Syntrophaceae bacterium]NMC90263.1 ribosome-associated translation inhibitor RaiA [Smithella sp.]HNV56066.1 ribosome-associated translation inhibitor RaiA [Smithellaceae bacterium]MBP8665387.1 ribosome-associated translation inhibitor RaiA [Syntrophaceae bacterium]MBP9532011.1 ribosome-associated translation inhibitor RaiA [Syntrophaceae bacterium]